MTTNLDLTEGMKKILEFVNDTENPTTTDIKQEDTILEHYSPDSIGRTCRRLAEHNYLEKDGGRPCEYSLTEHGYQIVKRRQERKERRLKKVNGTADQLQFSDLVETFQDYLSIDNVEEQFVQQSLESEVAVIDFKEFDRLYPDTADELLDRPQRVIDAAEVAVRETAAIDKEMDIRFTNLPEYREKRIRQINASDVGKLVTVPGIVLKASMARPILVNATFECRACGDRVEKEQQEGKLSSPYKCDCGNRTFDTVEREFDTVRILKLQEKPDSPDKKTVKVRVFGNMANEATITEMNPGTPVRLTGVVEAEEPSGRDNNYFDLYISAIDVDEEQNKWEEIQLTERDQERNQEIAEYGAVNAFQESIARDRVIHRDLLKEAFLLFLLGKSETGNLHVLVMGEPGTGKSQLNNWAEEYMPKTIKAVATTSTGVGLTATVKEDKDFGGYVAQGGSLTLADGGYHITDEFDKINSEDVENFNEALQDGEITLNKGDITNLRLNANVSEWATANPRKYDYFDPADPKYQQIPIPPNREATKDRFDVIIGVETYAASSEQKKDVAEHILKRNNPEYEDAQPRYTPAQLVKFITEASRLEPEITDDAHDLLYEGFFQLLEPGDETRKLITNRKLEALHRLSIAYARADLSEEVTVEHARLACDFFKRSLESIDFEVGKDSFGDVQPKAKTDSERVLTAINEVADKDGEAHIEDVIAEVPFGESRAEEVLARLKKEGEIWKPRAGKVKRDE